MTKSISWRMADILHATKGELSESESGVSGSQFSGISIDSRRISPDQVFVAIRGDVHDGHGFAGDVVEKGGRCLILEKNSMGTLPWEEWRKKRAVCVVVDDTTTALGDLGAFHRKRSNASVVAITGSNGKTTTRRMTARVMAQRFRTLSSRKSFNNAIGVPLTLLNIDDSHEWAVLELGMNMPGEIRHLAGICAPDIGMITNVGPAHIGRLGSMEAIMKAKGELLERLGPQGTTILNADDPRSAKLAVLHPELHRVIRFGTSEKAQVRGESVGKADAGISFTLAISGDRLPIHMGVHGTFMVSNALAAAAAGYVLGLSLEEIKAGLEDFEPVQGRMNILTLGDDIHLIDDTYNANLGSMEAAIETLRHLKGESRGIFVAGDMLELGDHSESMHRQIGAQAAGSGVAKLYATGDFADAVAAGAREKGMDSRNILTGTQPEILDALKDSLRPGDWVLIKGSRGIRMEDVVEGVKAFLS